MTLRTLNDNQSNTKIRYLANYYAPTLIRFKAR